MKARSYQLSIRDDALPVNVHHGYGGEEGGAGNGAGSDGSDGFEEVRMMGDKVLVRRICMLDIQEYDPWTCCSKEEVGVGEVVVRISTV